MKGDCEPDLPAEVRALIGLTDVEVRWMPRLDGWAIARPKGKVYFVGAHIEDFDSWRATLTAVIDAS